MLTEYDNEYVLHFAPSDTCEKGKGRIAVGVAAFADALTFTNLNECIEIGKRAFANSEAKTLSLWITETTGDELKNLLITANWQLLTGDVAEVTCPAGCCSKPVRMLFYCHASISVVLSRLEIILEMMNFPWAA